MPLISPQFRATAWQAAFACLDRFPLRRTAATEPQHLQTGAAGEEAALFYLRKQGFTVVAHGWRSGRAPGDLDLVAWEGETLCFIEVKTRTSRAVAAAEASINFGKRRALRRLASYYLRQLPDGTLSRFDVVTIYLKTETGIRVELYRNAFGWKERD